MYLPFSSLAQVPSVDSTRKVCPRFKVVITLEEVLGEV